MKKAKLISSLPNYDKKYMLATPIAHEMPARDEKFEIHSSKNFSRGDRVLHIYRSLPLTMGLNISLKF